MIQSNQLVLVSYPWNFRHRSLRYILVFVFVFVFVLVYMCVCECLCMYAFDKWNFTVCIGVETNVMYRHLFQNGLAFWCVKKKSKLFPPAILFFYIERWHLQRNKNSFTVLRFQNFFSPEKFLDKKRISQKTREQHNYSKQKNHREIDAVHRAIFFPWENSFFSETRFCGLKQRLYLWPLWLCGFCFRAYLLVVLYKFGDYFGPVGLDV